MNILIADDEKKVRLTLISMLQEMNMYFEKLWRQKMEKN